MNTPANNIARDLRIFLSSAAVLTLLGLVFVYSASSVYALEQLGNPHYFFARHLFSLVLAGLGFSTFYVIPTRFWQTHAPLFFGGALVLSLIGLLPQLTHVAHGATKWLYIGRFGVQPGVLLPLFACLYLGHFIAVNDGKGWPFWRGYLPIVVMIGFTVGMLLEQGDVGTALVVLLTVLLVCFVAACHALYLGTALGGIASVIVFAFWKANIGSCDALNVVATCGDSASQGNPVAQSLIAIGSGGWWGTGVAYSKQKLFYLPMQHTDFIFSIIAEEVGFIGCALIIAAYGVFAAYGFRLVRQLHRSFATYATLSFVCCIMLQVVLNMLVATGLAPLNGLGLPFVSFAGSSLLVLGCMLGVITNAIHEQIGPF